MTSADEVLTGLETALEIIAEIRDEIEQMELPL